MRVVSRSIDLWVGLILKLHPPPPAKTNMYTPDQIIY